MSDRFDLLTEAVIKKFSLSAITDKLTRRDRLPLLEGLLNAIRLGEFTLSSGAKSDFYIDARTVTMNPAIMPYVAGAVLERADTLRASSVGGPATASIPMSTAAATMGAMSATPECMGPRIKKTFWVRPEAKQHGTKTLIDGIVPVDGDRILLVDDVLTSGKSILHAATAVRELTDGVIVGAFVLVDREEGGYDALAKEGIEVISAYRRSELTKVKKAIEEITAARATDGKTA